MPPAERDRIFQPFYRISNRLEGPAGAGIGLSISAVSANMQQAMLYTFVLIMPMMLLSGLTTPVSNMPRALQIATMANQPHDNLRVLEMMQESDCPTIGMCMGDIGTPSRILGPKFGAPFTYATFHHERALAPGHIAVPDVLAADGGGVFGQTHDF